PGRAIDNDFALGAEDPQGHHCPLGSHVRRSNPRDSLGEDRETQIQIGKRHRILRVGRTYEKKKRGGKVEKGLLFMCLNADIERQYEFIQQTWVSSTSFQGLVAEKDPMIGTQEGSHGRFSIPSWEKVTVLENMPQFVTTKGGGYFFMPSRSALRYLISRL
ncbi:MAG: cytochrome, partial [Mesorhizobium sp.]